MKDTLDKMNPEKRIRLINAAMREFGENSFDKASTNKIVKEAGISKGLLYHYFDSKEDLFDYLFDYALDAVAKPIAEEIGLEDQDILRRIERITKLKLKIIHEMPALVTFSKAMYAGMDYETFKQIIEKHHPVPIDEYYQHNIDVSLFKEGINVSMAIQNIQYTLEKIGDQYLNLQNMNQAPEVEVVMAQVEAFLTHFRSIYYR